MLFLYGQVEFQLRFDWVIIFQNKVFRSDIKEIGSIGHVQDQLGLVIRRLATEQFLCLFKLVVIDMKVIDEVKELPNLPAKVLSNHHLKSDILHGVDVMGDEHVI